MMHGKYNITYAHLIHCFGPLQFLAKASRMPVREDEIFAKNSLVAKKNRYKDKCPCE